MSCPDLHGGGLGHRLLDTAEAHARAAGAQRLVLWSDTRFDRAHRFYEKRSYIRSGPIRVLDDISNSLEFAYAKPVNGIERLDAAAAASAIPRLSEILIACVAEGAGVPFLPPLAPETARAFWQSVARQVAAGSCVPAGGLGGRRAGRHGHAGLRAGAEPAAPRGVEKLLVHPSARRRWPGAAPDAACRAGSRRVPIGRCWCWTPAPAIQPRRLYSRPRLAGGGRAFPASCLTPGGSPRRHPVLLETDARRPVG